MKKSGLKINSSAGTQLSAECDALKARNSTSAGAEFRKEICLRKMGALGGGIVHPNVV